MLFRIRTIIVVATGLGFVSCGPADPVLLDTRVLVEELASDEFEGRLTGSTGIKKAADYITGQLNAIGAEPLPGSADFGQPFTYTAGVNDVGTSLDVVADDSAEWAASSLERSGVRGLAFSNAERIDGPLVFAGYGLSVPETDRFSYDSYGTLDVTGKIVVVLRYFPEDAEGTLRGTLSRYAGLRYKAFAARERGAIGLIVVTGPRSPNAGELVPLTFDNAMGDSGIVAATVDGELGAALIESSGESLESVQASLDTANPHATGFE